MKKVMVFEILVVLLGVPVQATHYEITTDIYTPGLTLQTGDSLYMTDGGFGSLNLLGEGITATIEGTSDLNQFSGGIWEIDLTNNNYLDVSGGQIHEIDIGNDATAFLSGGLIQQIWSQQIAWETVNEQLVWNPHITIECLDHFYDSDSKLLTGHWLDDGVAFSIHLIDIQGYSPAIENIQFIPEPMTILLLGFGGLLLRSRKR